MTENSGKSPFSEGDLLCLEGPNIHHGRYVHVAGAPLKRGNRWCNGYVRFGNSYGAELRFATLEDIEHELRFEEESIARAASRIEKLEGFKNTL